jgi:molybdate transport system permease protein
MGLPEWRVALRVTLPLARRGIIGGIALAFGRALGDYAATSLLSGGGPHTTTMSIALYDDVTNRALDSARTLAVVQLAVALAIMIFVGRLGRSRV